MFDVSSNLGTATNFHIRITLGVSVLHTNRPQAISASYTNAPSAMNKETGRLKYRGPLQFTILPLVLLTIWGSSSLAVADESQVRVKQSGEDVLRDELIDRIVDQAAICYPHSRVDVRVKSESSQHVGDEVVPESRSKFRYIFDFERDRVFAAYQSTPDESKERAIAPLQFGAFCFADAILREFSPNDRKWRPRPVNDLAEAMSSGRMPFPFFHAAMTYPSFNPAQLALKQVVEIVSDNSNSVSVRTNGRLLVFTVRIEHEPTRYDNWSWTFDTQSGVMTERTVDRAIASTPRRYYECVLNWSIDTEGHPRLDDYMSTELIVVQDPTFKSGRRIGERRCTVGLNYHRVSKDFADEISALNLQDSASLLGFLSAIE
ncbi:hypothetical protein [Neorhodopirellula lusitana]|uniref:hypothetical protein n=1 Tax=Neorhodopirellula lusitana TaxID=445327 RepID=UPI00384E3FCD